MAVPSPETFTLDRALLRARFERTAATCDDAAVLTREIGRRMDERLDYIRVIPQRIADLGCGGGEDLTLLAKRYPQAARFGVDFALSRLRRARGKTAGWKNLLPFNRRAATHWIGGDLTALPFKSAILSMIWSNLTLHWLADPLPAMKEMHRTLETGGVLMFSTFGPDTLKELRAALPTTQGERIHRFIDMHDLGDALLQAGFCDPVMDMEILTLTYADIDSLFSDLRRAGDNNAAGRRPRGLSGKTAWAQARTRLETLRKENRIPATFEIVYGHAWKAAPTSTDKDDRAVIRFHSRPPR